MANVFVENAVMQNIANAIRAKTGSPAPLRPDQMANAIASIPAGGGAGGDGQSYRDDLIKILSMGGSGTLTIPAGISQIRDYVLQSSEFSAVIIPDGVTYIGVYSMASMTNLEEVVLPASVTRIRHHAFAACPKLKVIYLKSVNCDASSTSFDACTAVTDIYCAWASGAVPGAPWGAVNATVHYNWIA